MVNIDTQIWFITWPKAQWRNIQAMNEGLGSLPWILLAKLYRVLLPPGLHINCFVP